MLPVVSIVGRPNVGKSTLFNRLIGARKAIVDDEYGVTRDRHYGQSDWNGRNFTIIDTGGYLPDESDKITAGVREQVHIAMSESDVIMFVVDVEAGITSLDQSVANLLRQQDKPVLLVANKADNEERKLNATEFYALGFGDLFAISSVNGTGTGELLDRLVELLPEMPDEEEIETPRLAIIGRPNVGKSSFVNALLNDERSIVTDIPGTTRDSINSRLIYNEKEYILVDTAGLRKKKNVKENIEFYSTVRTERAIRECDVAILLVDAMQGFESQDKHILHMADELNKGIVLVLNKWDLVPEKTTNLLKEFEEYVYDRIPTKRWIPIVSMSATNRKRIHRVIDVADNVLEERKRLVPTPVFNDFLQRILKERPLPIKRGVRLKIKYATQVKSNPPVFKFFMNMPSELPANYRRFIENKIREEYGFTGVPITLTFKQK
ncbi:ribosome biogenesis GTPase Der [Aliifodinibius sp. S!AR15-10]|uniref:ribosome biogenesis GTPase Der n=1 Tax=Aliifodinibius sp. S!AR15-10 TaxID=2950437 RepID=UPI002870A504|nr:ribosome biogenesis GTPase Der [Aliifodinibius sp. S!AR15-10]